MPMHVRRATLQIMASECIAQPKTAAAGIVWRCRPLDFFTARQPKLLPAYH